MYGMVNKAVEDMVCMHFDEATWEQIKAAAGVDVDVFVSNEGYPDGMTYDLVAAASAILERPAPEVLEAFGRHWVMHTAHEGYGDLMTAGGATLPEFLCNLPGFHARVALIFPNLQPPSFQVSNVQPDSLHLHYYSHRAGLQPFVLGLLRGLAERFETMATIVVVASRETGADHEEFLVTWPNNGTARQ